MNKVEQQQEMLKVLLTNCLKHPLINLHMGRSRYIKTFRSMSMKTPSTLTRWHVLSVDWTNPHVSIWKAVWHLETPPMHDSEYLHVLDHMVELDARYNECDDCLTNLRLGQSQRKFISELGVPR